MALGFVRRHPAWTWIALVLLLIGVLLLIYLPRGIQWSLERWLEKQGRISVQIEDVDFNPFTGNLIIETLLAQREEAPGRIRWDRATLTLEWWPLTRRRIMLDEMSVRDAVVTVRRSEGAWFIGGLKIKSGENSSGKKSPWKFGFGDIDLHKVKFLFLDGPIRKEFFVEEAHLESMQEWNSERIGSFRLQVQAAGAPITLTGQARPFADQPIVDGRLEIADFPLQWLAPWVDRPDVEIAQGRLSTGLDLATRVLPGEGRLRLALTGTVSLENLQGRFAGTHLEGGDLQWQGKAQVAAPRESRPPLVSAEGTLSSAGMTVVVEEADARVLVEDFSVNEEFAMGTGEVPEDADFLLDQGSAGPLKIVDTGRELVLASMQQLQLAGMQMKGSRRIALGSLKVTDLRLLQIPQSRPVKMDHYLELDTLEIEGVEGSPSGPITIAATRLDGLQGALILGEDGRMDLSPWSFNEGGDKKTSRENKEPGQEQVPGKSFPAIRLGLLEIGGKNQLLFLDRSVEPAARISVTPLKARVENVDTAASADDAPVRFDLRIQAEGHPLTLKGTARPFGTPVTVEAKVGADAWPLTLARPYLGPDVEIDQGTFGLEATLTAALENSGRLDAVLDGSMDLAGVRGEMEQVKVRGGSARWQGKIALEKERATTAVTMDGTLRLAGVQGSTAEAELRRGSATWKGEIRLQTDTAPEKTPPRLKAKGTLAIPEAEGDLASAPLRFQAQQVQIKGEFAMGTSGIPQGTPFVLSAEGETGLLRGVDPKRDLEVFALDALRLKGLRLAGPKEMDLESLTLRAPRALERPGQGAKEEPSHVAQAQALEITGLRTDGSQEVHIGELHLVALQSALVRDARGQFDLGAWMGEQEKGAKGEKGETKPPPTSEKTSEKDAEKTAEPLQIWADLLAVTGESRLLYSDLSVDPPVRLELTDLEARIENLDTRPGTKAPVLIQGKFGKYSPLKISGTMTTLTAHPTMKIATDLEGFDLPAVTGYVEKYVGYRVKSGELGIQLQADVVKGKMEAKTTLVLTKLDLEGLSTDQRLKTEKELGFPLKTGLSLLKDKQGTITLEFPVSGDIHSPKIGIAEIVRTAVVKAMREAAVSYFANLGASTLGAPVGAAFLAKRLFDKLTAVRFRPVVFAPGMAVVSPENRTYLKEMAGKLEQRPEITLALCGVAVPADTGALPPEAGEEALRQLAAKRSDAVKGALVEMGVAPGRLVQCAPEILEKKDEEPRVEVGI